MDSIELAWEVSKILKSQSAFQPGKTLDLCAGCGVIGFELNFHMPEINTIDFNEVQDIYKPHFESNLSLVKNAGDFRFLNFNYEKLRTDYFSKKYNLILCNPPYFQITQGKLSPSDFKNRCRFYIDSTFETLLQVMDHCLSDDGQAFLLLRPLNDHGLDVVNEAQKFLQKDLHLEILGDIRKTLFAKISRQY